MSRLLIIRKQVVCIAVMMFVFLLGTHSVARAFMYSIDGASPSVPGVSGADILTTGGPPGGSPTVAFTAVSLGLVATDEIDALSFGPITGSEVLFSVDRASTGAAGTAVLTESTAGQAAGDTFITPLFSPGTNTLDFNQDTLGLAPGIGPGVPTAASLDNLDAWDDDTPSGGPIFFSLATGSTSLATAAHPLFGLTPGDIFMSSGGVASLAFSHGTLGLTPGDDIDALVFDFGSFTTLFSLAPGSPSLIASGLSAADVFIHTPGFPSLFAGPSAGPFSLGLLAGDNLNALDLLHEEDDIPVPEPTTFALLGIGLAGLGGGYLRRRRRQKQ